MTTLLTDIGDFIDRHRDHGSLTGDATESTEYGYLLTVKCSCGVVFERWVTPLQSTHDPACSPMLALAN